MYRETVLLSAPGEDLGDGPSWGADVPVRARVDRQERLIRDSTGEQRVVAGTFICKPDTDVQTGHRVTVDAAQRTVFTVAAAIGPTGRPRHLEVTFL